MADSRSISGGNLSYSGGLEELQWGTLEVTVVDFRSYRGGLEEIQWWS